MAPESNGVDDTSVLQDWIDGAADEIGAISDTNLKQAILFSFPATRYIISAPLRLKSYVGLFGFNIFAHADFVGDQMIELEDPDQEHTRLLHMVLEGNRANNASLKGIVLDNDGGTMQFNDSHHVMHDVYVHDIGGNAVTLDGSSSRANKLNDVRVAYCGGDGFVISCVDSQLVSCEAGSCTTDGLTLEGANNRIIAFKSWFNRHGFGVAAVRNQLIGCEAQDCTHHGYNITAGYAILSGCQTDSCSRTNDNTYSGFYLGGVRGVVITGASVYEKFEGGRPSAMKYGYELDASTVDCFVSGWARDTRTGVFGGAGLTGAGNVVNVSGEIDASVAKDGSTRTAQRISYGPNPTIIPIVAMQNNNLTLGESASASTTLEIGASNRFRQKVDLSKFTEVRLVARLATAARTGTTLRAYYGTDTNHNTVAGTALTSAVACDTTGFIDSGWEAIPAAAKTDTILDVYTITNASAAAASGVIQQVTIHLR